MSATKRDSFDGIGGSERDYDYELWSGGLPQISDEDIERMAAEDEMRFNALCESQII